MSTPRRAILMLMSPQSLPPAEAASSLDAAELHRFSKLAAEWWDPHGKFKVLHVFNPVRLAFIKEQATARFHRDPFERRPLAGLRLLDIGCGGGLLSEPMARLGADVVGIDPVEGNIVTAGVHAAEVELAIDYRATTAEALLGAGESFDIVLNMEVIEHVSDPGAFMRTSAGLLRPGGLMFIATINRTLKSFGMAIIGAEYVLGWLPRGTHQWEKFIAPEELRGWVAENALDILAETGVAYSPFTGEWRLSRDMDVNYMMLVGKSPQL
jgi:2-polyprenyl-6-hydroxyphenyl methylase / 3-demethylubiquinone-9 3-methyltransferase